MVAKPVKPASRNATHTIYNAARTGNKRKLLVALRNKIAQQLDEANVQSRDFASLSKRLVDITMLIDRIDHGNTADDPARKALEVGDEILDADS